VWSSDEQGQDLDLAGRQRHVPRTHAHLVAVEVDAHSGVGNRNCQVNPEPRSAPTEAVDRIDAVAGVIWGSKRRINNPPVFVSGSAVRTGVHGNGPR
jgi:hypothetical protein